MVTTLSDVTCAFNHRFAAFGYVSRRFWAAGGGDRTAGGQELLLYHSR